MVPQSLEVVLQEVATPPSLSEQGEDTFDAIASRHVCKECPVVSSLPTYSAVAAKLRNTMRDQIAIIPALIEDDVVRLFGEAGQATETIPDTKVVSRFQTVVKRVLVKYF